MNKMFSTLFSAMRAKVTSIWTKIRLWLSPAFWSTQGVVLLRKFFSNLFNIKPRDPSDYYPVFRWLISKRLAFALVIVLGAVGGYYILMMLPASSGARGDAVSIRTYHYDSVPLKFYSGTVRILARDKHVAYVGDVDGGAARGKGSLYRTDGSMVYDGQFSQSMFNGAGKLFYPDGTLRYEGAFENNLYHGEGISYRSNGVKEYQGNYLNNLRSGLGNLFNGSGSLIFTGQFLNDHLLYSEFVNKSTKDTAAMYVGESAVYSTSSEYCVEMKELGAVYGVDNGANSLNQDWTVNNICVLSSSYPLAGGEALKTVNQLTAHFGKPDYFGVTYVNLTEAVALNLLSQTGPAMGTVAMQTAATLDNVYSVTSYDKNFQVYIYTYLADGLVYTFYCPDSTSDFVMYSIHME